jgi:Zn-dependent alcohol dehydrogenase
MAAKYLGLHQIIAVDVQPARLRLAQELGATHLLNSKELDVVKEIKNITKGGAAFAVECTGIIKCLEDSIECMY